MNFTREPIIETIVSPKDGFKLLVRSSKGGNTEEYYVDALEVVSFGRAFFFRSLEAPKSFLVPTSDYEVLEVKETRVALKNASHERNIKIGGGREAPVRNKERAPLPLKEEVVVVEEESIENLEQPEVVEARMDKRKDRRRHRRRRPDDQEWNERGNAGDKQHTPDGEQPELPGKGGGLQDEMKVSSSMFTHLIPPPSVLISQTLSRYKGKEFFDEPAVPQIKKEEDKVKEEKDEPPHGDDSESSPLHCVQLPLEAPVLTATHFSFSRDPGDFNPLF